MIGLRGAAIAALALVTALALSAGAEGATVICPVGTDTEQCSGPGGLATDRTTGEAESGRLYVADRGNSRGLAFDDAGDFLFAFGEGLLHMPNSVAADDFAASPALHDVYAVDFGDATSERRILRFNSAGELQNPIGEGEYEGKADAGKRVEAMLVAVGPGGEVYVVDVRRSEDESPGDTLITRLRRYEPSGGPPLFEKDVVSVDAGAIFGGNLRGLAVDSTGNLFIRNGQPEPSLCKYDKEGTLVASFGEAGCLPSGEVDEAQAAATDKADHLFVVGRDDRVASLGTYRVVAEFDPEGNPLRRFGHGELYGPSLEGLAIAPGSAGPAYVSDGTANPAGPVVLALDFPPPGPLIAPEPCKAPDGARRSVSAALVAEVNPEGDATSYHFQYMAKADYEAAGNTFTGATRLPAEASEDPETDADPKLHLASLEATGLTPATEYACRLVAENAKGEALGQAGFFKTREPLELLAVWASDPGTEGTRLHGEVNPRGSATTGHFEYVTEVQFKASGFTGAATTEELDFGSGETPVLRGATLSGLASRTAYRYRLVASNVFAALEREGSFRTFAEPRIESCPNDALRAGAHLPDCRAYEMVSPPAKNGADVIFLYESLGFPAMLEQSSVSGSKLAYASIRAFADPESSPYTPQHIAERHGDLNGDGELDEAGGEGWQTHSIDPPRGAPLIGAFGQADTTLKALSPDLCKAWMRPVTDLELDPEAVPDSLNLYRRTDESCGGGPAYGALTKIAPDDGMLGAILELQGHSADGERAIYTTNDSLQPGAGPTPPQGKRQLYVVGPEGTRSVCVESGGTATASAAGCSAGTHAQPPNQAANYRQASLQNAISADGERIYWTDAEVGPGPIYVRLNPFAKGAECSGGGSRCTVAVSAAGEALTGGTELKSQFWAAAEDGSGAVFTTTNKAGASDLYAFELEGEVGTTTEIAGEVLGVAGVSADAGAVYFASREAIDKAGQNSEGDEAIPGKANLYRHEGGDYAFVATLAAGDAAQSQNTPSPLNKRPVAHTARVTPDGSRLAFMSYAGPASEAAEEVPAPTGYDNTDLISGQAAAEAYLYDASASGGGGRLICASCNPSEARPVAFNRGADIHEVLDPTYVAAQIPVWLNSLHAPRALSEDGRRLYFESVDTLSPRDSNGARDVYQWEAPGKGGCDAKDASFSEPNGGCVDLISSGTSSRDSEFRDADPSGENVFIGTLSSLLPQDFGLVDIYDAREGGGLPAPPELPAECEGTACQSPDPPPDPPPLASEGFAGPGNVLPEAAPSPCARVARKAKRAVRAAKATRRKARRMARRGSDRAAVRTMRRSRRIAKRARRQSKAAKRCRRARAGKGKGGRGR